jgi:hypothetical protein
MLPHFRVLRDVFGGVTNSFRGESMYIALRDAPLLNLIFQRGGEQDAFSVEELHFILVKEQADLDIFTYRVSSGVHFNELLFFFGVEASRICGPRSNVDFVHFVWENFERFNFRKYSLAVVPSPSASLPHKVDWSV